MKKLILLTSFVSLLTACNNNLSKKNYKVDESISRAAWKGSAADHFHTGSFIVSGHLTADVAGHIESGDFVIPISSIRDLDLLPPAKQTLLSDLKSSRFFNIALHPNAAFHLTKVTAYSNTDKAAINDANYMITGDFTMIGKTHAISIPAKITFSTETVITEARFKLNRLKWGMDIFNDPKQGLYILPDIDINLLVKASKNS